MQHWILCIQFGRMHLPSSVAMFLAGSAGNVRVVATCSAISCLHYSTPSTQRLSLQCPSIFLLVFLYSLFLWRWIFWNIIHSSPQAIQSPGRSLRDMRKVSQTSTWLRHSRLRQPGEQRRYPPQIEDGYTTGEKFIIITRSHPKQCL